MEFRDLGYSRLDLFPKHCANNWGSYLVLYKMDFW